MKIGIIGNYGATNVGDDAILTAIIKSHSDHEITVFSVNPEKTHQQFGVKTVHLFPLGIRSGLKFNFHRSIKALKELDAVILGGGGLFQDNYLYACFLWAWQVFWVKRLKKPLFIYATGVGPLNKRIGKKLTKWAYNQADVITVRDEKSRGTPVRIGIDEEKVHVTSDPAFLYQKADITKDRTKNLYIISVRPWLNYNLKIISAFTSFLEKLKAEKEAEFIFVSMQQIKEYDRRIIDFIIKKTGGELYIPNHFSDLLNIMRTAEFAIGMRYHFLIAALLTETPVIPVSYSPKIDELFRGTPLENYLIPVNELSPEYMEQVLKRLSVDYNNVKIYEKMRTKTLAESAKKNAALFEDFLKSFDQK